MTSSEDEGSPATIDRSAAVGPDGGDRGSRAFGDAVHPKEEEPRHTRRAFAYLAVAVTLGGAGLTFALFLLFSATPLGGTFGLPADSVTVVAVTVNFGLNQTGNASGDLGLDPVQLAHCSFVWLDPATNQLIVRTAHYDTGTSTVLLINYPGRESFSGGGDDQLVVFLRPGEVATVVAAWNATTPLYRVNPDNRDLFEPIATARPERDLLIATYHVNFTQAIFNVGGPGTYEVQENHLWVQHREVPVMVRGGGMCM